MDRVCVTPSPSCLPCAQQSQTVRQGPPSSTPAALTRATACSCARLRLAVAMWTLPGLKCPTLPQTTLSAWAWVCRCAGVLVMRLTHLSMQHPLVYRYHLYYINAAGDKTEKVLPGTAKTYTIDNCRGQPLTPGQEVYCNIECVPHILGLLPSAAPT